ncbi:MAG: (2Fe-2S)-binding protein [Gammaproteobacteria bacterium]|nr:(2Fe-2S)-binding protein [Gammaproteobacteria bacterium]
MTDKQTVALSINGESFDVTTDTRSTVLQVLREDLSLTGTKCGCNNGVCGSCTVLVDGEPMRACLMLAVAATDREITTIEGLEQDGALHPVQQAFIEHQGLQCGFCTPGMIISAKALLDRNPNPSPDEIRSELSGNLCRCTGYVKIAEAVLSLIGKTVEQH